MKCGDRSNEGTFRKYLSMSRNQRRNCPLMKQIVTSIENDDPENRHSWNHLILEQIERD